MWLLNTAFTSFLLVSVLHSCFHYVAFELLLYKISVIKKPYCSYSKKISDLLSSIHLIQIFLSKWGLFPDKLLFFFFYKEGARCKVSLPKIIFSVCQNCLLSPIIISWRLLGALSCVTWRTLAKQDRYSSSSKESSDCQMSTFVYV